MLPGRAPRGPVQVRRLRLGAPGVALLFGAGVLLSGWNAPSGTITAGVLGLTVCACGIALSRVPLSKAACRAAAPALLCGVLLLLAAGAGHRRAVEQRPPALGVPLSELGHLEATVRADAHPGLDGALRLQARLQSAAAPRLGVLRVDASGTVMLTLRTGEAFYQGERVRVELGAEGFRDARGGLWFRVRERDITRLGFSSAGLRLRARALAGAERSVQVLGRESGRLFAALVFGLRQDLAPAEVERFRRAGAMHVLALSGMHLGILAALCVFLIRPLLGRNAALVAASVGACVYVLLVGLRPSLLRALLMYLPAAYLHLQGRRAPLLDILALSFIGVLVIDPVGLESLSFQLSFAALAGIALLAPPLARRLQCRLPPVIAAPLAAATAAQLGTAPFLAYNFEVLHPVGVVSSIVLVPLVTAFLWVGIVGWGLLLILEAAWSGAPSLAAPGLSASGPLAAGAEASAAGGQGAPAAVAGVPSAGHGASVAGAAETWIAYAAEGIRWAPEQLYRLITATAGFFAAAPQLTVTARDLPWVLGALTAAMVLRYYQSTRAGLRLHDAQRRFAARHSAYPQPPGSRAEEALGSELFDRP